MKAIKLGQKIRIIRMEEEPQYSNREGVVLSIDDMGQIHGTWGGLALTKNDLFEIID